MADFRQDRKTEEGIRAEMEGITTSGHQNYQGKWPRGTTYLHF